MEGSSRQSISNFLWLLSYYPNNSLD